MFIETYMYVVSKSCYHIKIVYDHFDVDLHRPKESRGNEKDKFQTWHMIGTKSSNLIVEQTQRNYIVYRMLFGLSVIS